MPSTNRIYFLVKNLKNRLITSMPSRLKGDFIDNKEKEEILLEPYKPVKKTKSLKRLGYYKNTESNGIVSSHGSRFSQEYYENFQLERIPHPNTFPFFITLSDDLIDFVSERTIIKSKKEFVNIDDLDNDAESTVDFPRKRLIDYYDESDYFIIYDRLTELDIHILLLIATFRKIQFLQIVKETGARAERVEKSLKRLHRYYLIDKWKFNRDPNIEKNISGRETGYSYSVLQNGTTLLLVTDNISQEFAFKWKEIEKEKDSYRAIRCWKVVDTYLDFRVKSDFKYYAPYSYLEAFQYTDVFELPNKTQQNNKNAISQQTKDIVDKIGKKQSARTVKTTRTIGRVRFDGELYLENNDRKTKIDLFPFLTYTGDNNDLDNLLNIFKHFGKFENGFDEFGYKRYLMIIVDSIKEIEIIENHYHMSTSYDALKNIIFFDLELASKVDIQSATKILVPNKDENSKTIKTVAFDLSENYELIN